MADVLQRSALAALLLLLLALGLTRLTFLPRDLALTGFALVVAVLGIFAILGPLPALIGGAIIVGVFILGALVYAALALVARWTEPDR
jgi:hypothetical protein